MQCIRQLLVPQAVMQIGLDKFVKEAGTIVPLAAVVRKSDACRTQTARIRVRRDRRTRLRIVRTGMDAENL